MDDLLNWLGRLVEPYPPVTPPPWQRIFIRVPAATTWQPQQVQQFMVSLFAVSVLRLQIKATAEDIEWRIEVPMGSREAIIKTVYAFFSQAQLATKAAVLDWGNFTFYPLRLRLPFVAPLKYAEDFRHNDPLAIILAPMSVLKGDEAILYELALQPASGDHYRQGRRLATTSAFTLVDYLTIGGAASALAHKIVGTDREPRFESGTQAILDAKLNSPLKVADFAIEVRTSTPNRANYLAGLFRVALAQFEREGFNALTQQPNDSFPLVLCPQEVAALWHLPTADCKMTGIHWTPANSAPLPAELASQTQGILLGSNQYQGQTQQVWLSYPDRVSHLHLAGKTRTGKSTLLHRMIHQDIVAGKGVGVIDPHGDLVENVLATSIPTSRVEDVVLFDVGDRDHVIGLNLLAAQPGLPHEVIAGHALAIIRKLFADQWSAGRMEDACYAALMALSTFKGATIQDIPRLFSDPAFRQQVLAQVHDPIALEFWVDEYGPLTPQYQREIARPINHRIRKFYRDKTIRRIVCQQTSLDFRSILNEGKILLANLHGVGEIEGEVLGALLISQLQMAAMSRAGEATGRRTAYYLYIDETQNFVSSSLPKMFAEAGKYGLSLVIANQYLSQLAGDTLESIMGNVGATILFRLGPYDAQAFAPFVRPHFTVADLEGLSRFNAVVKMQLAGETLPAFSMQTFPPLQKPDSYLERIRLIRHCSHQKYARPKAVVDAEIAGRYGAIRQDTETESQEPGVDYFG